MNKLANLSLILAIVAANAAAYAPRQDAMAMTPVAASSVFKGAEVNGGTVLYTEKDGKRTLMLSKEFVIPKAPAPSWQVVDSMGNAYLLNQLNIVGGKTNRQVTLPGYIKDVAKVRIWCSFAEVNLGEASFATPVGAK